MKKKMLATMVAALALGTTVANASTSLCYYSFGPVTGGGTHSYGPKFSITNSMHVVTLKGWQTTSRYPSSHPVVYYSIVQYGMFSDTYYGGGEQVVTSNSTSTDSTNWYNLEFSNIPYVSGLQVRMDVNSSDTTQGAGNAYDGY